MTLSPDISEIQSQTPEKYPGATEEQLTQRIKEWSSYAAERTKAGHRPRGIILVLNDAQEPLAYPVVIPERGLGRAGQSYLFASPREDPAATTYTITPTKEPDAVRIAPFLAKGQAQRCPQITKKQKLATAQGRLAITSSQTGKVIPPVSARPQKWLVLYSQRKGWERITPSEKIWETLLQALDRGENTSFPEE